MIAHHVPIERLVNASSLEQHFSPAEIYALNVFHSQLFDECAQERDFVLYRVITCSSERMQ